MRQSDIEWRIDPGLVPYLDAQSFMEERAAAIREGKAGELIWFLEHPPLYTAGTSAREDDLLDPSLLPVFRTGRGGQFTYHGPGQRVIYLMLDLKRRGGDVRRFVHDLEEWLIRALNRFGIAGERRRDRVGVWVVQPDGSESKIAAIGVRVRKWVTFHGAALNVAPNLTHFGGIVPCGIRGHGVTSLADQGIVANMHEVDEALMSSLDGLFELTDQEHRAARNDGVS